MRLREQNFVAMGKVSISVLEKHAAKWQSNRRVKKAVADAKAVLAELETRNEGGLAKSGGTTSQKQDAADKAAGLAAKIAKRVKVYATDENRLDLKQKMSFSESDYHRMTDADLYAQLQNLIGSVTPILGELEDYGVTQQMLARLSGFAEDFRALETAPRALISERKMHNAGIPELLRMLRSDLSTIDGLIGIFEDPDLEGEYANARMVIDRVPPQKASDKGTGDSPQI